jgi:SAM-dependent methyltransferase
MHDAARKFTEFIKTQFPGFFVGKTVLDVGSGDINGNNRFLFKDCEYHGNDVYSAPNVTIVSKTSELSFAPNTFDTIISTECFEHDPEYVQSFQKIVEMLKEDGLFVFTCASTGRGEHGTRRTTPGDSYGTIGNVEGWTDYYKNLVVEDLDKAINISNTFKSARAYYHTHYADLYFWGIKKGNKIRVLYIPEYTVEPGVIKTY